MSQVASLVGSLGVTTALQLRLAQGRPKGERPVARIWSASANETSSFHDDFVALFNAQFPRLFRYLDRLSGEPELAADIAQDAFIRLYQKGTLPDSPTAWLISVAMNLFRNARSTRSRRQRLLTPERMLHAHSDPPVAPDAGVIGDETTLMVRAALSTLSDRDRKLLLLRAEGLSYREIAVALHLNETSVGVLLARAKQAFRVACKDGFDAP